MPARPAVLVAAFATAALLTIGLVGCSSAGSGSAAVGSSSGGSSSSSGGSGSSGSGSGSSAGGSASAPNLAKYQKAPCTMLPQAKAQSILGYSFEGLNSIPGSPSGECIYDPSSTSNITLVVGFNQYSLASLKSAYPKASYGTTDGFKTFCSPSNNVPGANFYAQINSGVTLYVTTNNCTSGTTIGTIALGEIG